MRTALVLLLHALVMVRTGGTAQADSCARDSDCVIDAFDGCCAMCPAHARARAKTVLEADKAVCAVASCAAPNQDYKCPVVSDPPLVARCEASVCVARTAPRAEVGCAHDSDCVLDDFDGCCPICGGGLQAFPKTELARKKAICARKKCPRPHVTVDCEAPDRTPLVARCEDARCIAAPAPPSMADECQTDSDCTVDTEDGCCPDFCPGTPRAVTKVALGKKRAACRPATCPKLVGDEDCVAPKTQMSVRCAKKRCVLLPGPRR